MLPRIELARTPTPIEPLARLGVELGLDLWVKRDDLTGLELSGNKVRKLELLLADARAQGATTLITCGGVRSNHCRATAAAARRLGLEVVLLLRGDEPAEPDGNLLIDRLLGATVHHCSPETYDDRERVMGELADGVAAEGGVPYVIPEGGSNALGSMGFALAAGELAEQDAQGFDAIVVAVGSGGTLAGLCLGPAPGKVLGIAVCDDRAFFVDKVRRIAADAAALGAAPLDEPGTSWDVIEGYQGAGYGLADAELWRLIEHVANTEGLLLDPSYTGKAMQGLFGEARAGRIGGRVLFWHTGGAFGLFGRGGEVW